ncbi:MULTISPECIES: hypothetical protein [Streptacidiphilus]|uniref:Uncharacterized protein n=1 Tax=Streptacidiphilus cavernicola TaxID=3342716 RepID=A0ABV6V1B5_9ACTN|nr:hypothetical protein [Streptacidiphilus jeojiense]
MASSEEEDRRRAERARPVGLFRYSLIQDLLDQDLTTRERGRLARELASREHTDPFGQQITVARGTLDWWTRHYRAAGSQPWSPSRARPSRGRRRRCWNWPRR